MCNVHKKDYEESQPFIAPSLMASERKTKEGTKEHKFENK